MALVGCVVVSSPATRKLHRQFPDHSTAAEVAEQCGRSKETIIRWRKSGLVVPSAFTMSGKVKVWLYSPDDVRRAIEASDNIVSGRKATKENINARNR